ncbi:glutamate-5-semialdehyde dehydrogenase [Fodinicurvata sediminis]|uniref:glutamate-5-semialdehyde dehydrogenase n=1 Tax=Fodinicurvata sediminis TaxID=1121832 RepID=UPI0003B6BE00|nr:glutamate-5-semialdehyde dehydrogenase [Fodinicurvata sediminis]
MTAETLESRTEPGLEDQITELGRQARMAAQELAISSTEQRNTALREAAAALRAGTTAILSANSLDLDQARNRGTTGAFLDRLALDEGRIEAMAKGLEDIAALPDPLGRTLAAWEQPSGLAIERRSVPLGVIGIIYESRPNVTADAGGLCLKSGNAAILRGGSESHHTSGVILDCLRAGLLAAGLPETALQRPPTSDRAAVGHLLRLNSCIDLIVPRGGRSLIERVSEESRIPVLAHLEGVNHCYLHAAADPDKALHVVLNAKMRRTGICGAMETLLVERSAAEQLLPPILQALRDKGCELRGDTAVRALDASVTAATDADWDTEYLDAILSVRLVDGLEQALAHIARHGSGHTECIVTEDAQAADSFLVRVDAAIVMQNTSTQFADGGEFGMGAEIGIATGKLHARGPVGADQLTSYKYLVRSNGAIRP